MDWFNIANSWVAAGSILRNLSSVGRVTELPNNPDRTKSHNYRHVRFGLHRLWDEGWRGNGTRALDADGRSHLVATNSVDLGCSWPLSRLGPLREARTSESTARVLCSRCGY